MADVGTTSRTKSLSPNTHTVLAASSNPYRTLVIMIMVLIVLMGMSEAMSRLVFFWHWGARLYDIQPLSYSLRLGWTFAPGSYKEFSINSLGFRRPEPVSVIPPAQTSRVFLVGGSTAFGMNGLYPQIAPKPLSYHDTIDYQLQELLQRHQSDRRVEVINAAVPEYRLYQELTLFQEKLVNLRPDAVIFIDGHNDISFLTAGSSLIMQAAPYWGNRHAWRAERVLNHPIVGPLFFMDIYLGRHSYFYHGLSSMFQRYGSRVTWTGDASNLWGVEAFRPEQEAAFQKKYAERLAGLQQALPLYVNLVKDLKAIASSRGIPVIYVLQPEIVTEPSELLSERDAVVQRLAFEHHRDFGTFAWRYLVRAISQALESLSSDDFRVLDLTKVASRADETPLYTDYCHLTREGNGVISDRLYQLLAKMMVRRGRPNGEPRPLS